MKYRTIFLNPSVVTAPDYLTIENQNRSDRYTALGHPLFRFRYGCFQKLIHLVISYLYLFEVRPSFVNG